MGGRDLTTITTTTTTTTTTAAATENRWFARWALVLHKVWITLQFSVRAFDVQGQTRRGGRGEREELFRIGSQHLGLFLESRSSLKSLEIGSVLKGASKKEEKKRQKKPRMPYSRIDLGQRENPLPSFFLTALAFPRPLAWLLS